MEYRYANKVYSEPWQAVIDTLIRLLQAPDGRAIIKCASEDEANAMNDLIQDAVDRIKIEFDGSELGPNPLWTPGQLTRDRGKVYLVGPYGQTVHTTGFKAKE